MESKNQGAILGSGQGPPAAQPSSNTTTIKCPECGSQKTWKDGLRYTTYGEIQRYICRDCAYRFSNSGIKPIDRLEKGRRQNLNCDSPIPFSSQVCVSQTKAMINLAKVETRTQEKAAGATKSQANAKGKILEVAWHLKKEGFSISTIHNYSKYLRLLVKRGADLCDPDNVKDIIALQESWGPASRRLAVAAYAAFASLNKIDWKPPKYQQTRKLPFIPLESEIDTLIAKSGKKIATLLQLLKETGMRIGEAYRLVWIDVDLEHNTITVNSPEKAGTARMLKISNKLAAMLNSLPKKGQKVFEGTCYNSLERNFYYVRKRAAETLKNPRLLKIHFHTLRHWKATMEYHRTKDILHIMKMLGHKRIENTLLYTQLITFETDEFHVKTAKTLEEACKLGEVGFEYFTTIEDTQIFRKRK